jgi:L-rhamnose-H+ transport protein
VQRLAVEAGAHADITLLRQAMMMDPLVGAVCNPDEIWQMVDEMLIAQEQWLPQYADEIARAKERWAKAEAEGTLIPPIVQGHAADLVKDAGAVTVLAGVALSLVGIVFVGLAGKFKEDELPAEEKRKAVAEFNFRKGMIFALVSGLCSASMNFGLQSGGAIETAAYDAAVKAGIVSAGGLFPWQGMPVIMVVLWGGFAVSALWCLQQNFKNRTFGDYARPSMRNALCCAAVGVMWVMQFVCTKAGEPLMGDLKYISFAVMMSSTVLFSTVIGIVSGEWKGTTLRTKAMLAAGTIVMTVGFIAISLGSKN